MEQCCYLEHSFMSITATFPMKSCATFLRRESISSPVFSVVSHITAGFANYPVHYFFKVKYFKIQLSEMKVKLAVKNVRHHQRIIYPIQQHFTSRNSKHNGINKMAYILLLSYFRTGSCHGSRSDNTDNSTSGYNQYKANFKPEFLLFQTCINETFLFCFK